MPTVELKVLLIEDNPGDARLVREYLADAGTIRATLTHVERLADGLAYLDHHTPDTILLDLSLPDSHGLETFIQVHDHAPNIPILVLTGSNDDALAMRALHAGAQEYLVKGNFDQHALARAVRYALERHQLVQQVRASEARMRMIIEHSADSLFIIDRHGTVRFVNPAAEQLFGRPAAEVIGRPFGFPLDSNGAETLEISRNNGETTLAEMRVQPAEWKGEPVHVASLRDVTEQVETHTALQKSEALNEAVLRSLTAHIAVLDEDGTIITVNEAWDTFACENGGPAKNAYVGDNYLKTCRQAATSDTTAQHVLDRLEAVLAGEQQSFSTEYPCHSPEERRWFSMHVTPLAGNGGVVVSHIAITDRVSAHHQLKESEQRYKSLFDHALDAIVLMDEEGQFVDVNVAASTLTGYSRDELLTMSAHDLTAAHAPADVQTEIWRQFRDEGVLGGEYTVNRADGTPIDVEFRAVANILPGLHLAIIRDITERKQAETELRRLADELRERVKEINVLYTVSHLVSQRELDVDDLLRRVVDEIPAGWQYPEQTCARITLGDSVYTSDGFTASRYRLSGRIVVRGEDLGAVEVFFVGDQADETTSPFLIEEYQLVDEIAARLSDAIERHRAEHALRESEQRYRLLAANATDMIARHLPDGTIDYVSPASRRILGYEPEEIVGRQTLALVHPEDRGEIAQRLRHGLRSDDVQTFQFRARHKDGSYVWLESTGRAIAGPHTGAVPKGISISRDITERYQRERELEAIASVARALREASDHTEMPPIILEQLFRLLDADRAGFGFITGDDPENVALAQNGIPFTREEQQISRRMIEAAVRSGDLLYDDGGMGDAVDETNTTESPDGEVYATASVPLITDNRTLGAIWVSRRTPFTEAELRVLGAVADIAASASNRAMLHAQREQRLQRIAALREIDAAISGSTDLRLILSTVLKQTVDQLGVDAASVLLLDEHTMTLECAAYRGFHTDATVRSTVGLNTGGAGLAARERRVVHIDNLQEKIGEFARLEPLTTEGFVTYFAVPLIAKGEVEGVLEVFSRRRLEPNAEWLDFLETLAGQAAVAVDNTTLFHDLQRSNAELKLAYDATIEGWARALDLRDEETEGHTRRVTEMTLTLARTLGLHGEDLMHIRRGALLHDIGKMGIPDSILLKPGPLDDEEWEEMRRHPVYAYNLLSDVDFLRPALDIPYCHHEKWDGSGYPRGLEGTQIPLPARIFAVVDVYDALTSDRPYRDAWPEEKALAHIREQAGQHFDPDVVKAFLALIT